MSPRIIFNHTDGTRQTVSAIPMGVCSQQIDVIVEDGIIAKVAFSGGCSGNTQGLSALTHSRAKDKKKVFDIISTALKHGWNVEIVK